MATVRREIHIDVSPAEAWDALRDVGALHTRLVRGFVRDTTMDDDARIVTFANGKVVRERIVAIDDQARRVVWSAVGPPFEHHNGAAEIVDDPDGGTRFVWIADVLPHAIADTVAGLMDEGIGAIKATLEGRASPRIEPGV